MASVEELPDRSGHVVIGVDTHKHVHVAAVLDPIGGILATLTIPTDKGGFAQLAMGTNFRADHSVWYRGDRLLRGRTDVLPTSTRTPSC